MSSYANVDIKLKASQIFCILPQWRNEIIKIKTKKT